jgi:hypothetical protein
MKWFVLLTLMMAVVASAANDREPIKMSRSAWGQTIMRWQISSDGTIEYQIVDGPLKFGTEQPLRTWRTKPDARRYDLIASLLNPARRWAGRELPCVSPMTDQDSGIISWGSKKLAYYTGCYETDTRSVVSTLMSAEQQIMVWASETRTKAGPQKGSTQ